MRSLRAAALCSLLGLPTFVGCGGPTMLDVHGKVVNNGQAIPLSNQATIQVILVPAEPQGEYSTYPANLDKATGEWRTAELVPPGKYKIAVLWMDPDPTSDKLKGKFNADKTPIVRDVQDESEIVIDLAKPQG